MFVIGTVGVLEEASRRGLIRLIEAVAKLRASDFIVAQSILDAALARDAAHRRPPPPVA